VINNLAVGYAQAGTGKDSAEALSQAARPRIAISITVHLAVLYEQGGGVPGQSDDANKWYAVGPKSADGIEQTARSE